MRIINFLPTVIIIGLISLFYIIYFLIISKKIYDNSKKLSFTKLKIVQQINDNFSTIKENIFKADKKTNSNKFSSLISKMFGVIIFSLCCICSFGKMSFPILFRFFLPTITDLFFDK